MGSGGSKAASTRQPPEPVRCLPMPRPDESQGQPSPSANPDHQDQDHPPEELTQVWHKYSVEASLERRIPPPEGQQQTTHTSTGELITWNTHPDLFEKTETSDLVIEAVDLKNIKYQKKRNREGVHTGYTVYINAKAYCIIKSPEFLNITTKPPPVPRHCICHHGTNLL